MPGKVLPEIDPNNRQFWDSCRRQAMELQRCRKCGRWRYAPSVVCPACSSFEFRWVSVSGRGMVYTCSILSRPASAAYKDDIPYIYAVVQLDEGVMMPTNLVGFDVQAALADPTALVSTRVGVRYREMTAEVTLPVFGPLRGDTR